jgi:membrane-bound ClpP family serine protease
MSGLELVFVVCAVFGGILFVFRLIMQLVGGDTDVAGEMPDDVPTGDALAGDADVSFRLISFQGIMAFFMMFGLVGLAFKRTMTGDDTKAVIVAAGAGIAVMFLQAKLMVYLLRLQSSGNINMQMAVGREGTVYLTIPPGGTGKAQIVVQNRLKIFDAISKSGDEIPTGDRVRVAEITDGNILVVERIAAPDSANGEVGT